MKTRSFAALVVGAVLWAPAAHALEPEISSDTSAQFYDVRSPTGETVLSRRRLTTTLGAGVYDLLPQAEGRRNGPELSFRTRVRYDADFGASPAETEVTNFGRLVPGFSRGPVDIMYGYLEGRRFFDGYLGFKLGRQYMTDALGWWAFDGAEAKITTPFYVAAEVYGGFEQRGGLPLSLPRFERDGIWRGDRSGYDPSAWSSFQPSAVAPAIGVAAETAGIPWFHSRVTYRRVNNTGSSNTSEFSNGVYTPVLYSGSRVSSERVGASFDGTLPEIGGFKGGGSYDLFVDKLATMYASLDLFASQKVTVSADYDYYRPLFDADSIWNFFMATPLNDLGLRVTYDASQKLTVSMSGRGRIFSQQTGSDVLNTSNNLGVPSQNYFPTSSMTFNGGGAVSGRYRWGDGQVGVRADGSFGPEGNRVGGDAYGEKLLRARYVLNARAGVWEWNDKLRPDREATSFNYVLGTGYVFGPKARALVDFEHDVNRISGQRFRAMLWLTVALAKSGN